MHAREIRPTAAVTEARASLDSPRPRSGIGRFNRFEFANGESLQAVMRRQRARIKKRLANVGERTVTRDQQPDGEWHLTIRGMKPAQIKLDEGPTRPGTTIPATD